MIKKNKNLYLVHLLRNTFFILFFILSSSLAPQIKHESGFFLRFLLGSGYGSIRDTSNKQTGGAGSRSSLALGSYFTNDLAWHTGLSITQNSHIKFDANENETAREGKYTHYAWTLGTSYFWPDYYLYLSLEGRYTVGGNYELQGSNIKINTEDSGITEKKTSNKVRSFQDEEKLLGWAIIAGTEEWLFSHHTGMGIALIYSYDFSRDHSFVGASFSITYSSN